MPSLADYELAEAEGRCECGIALDIHPPLTAPRPWSHGRPCARNLSNFGFGATFSTIEPPRRVGIQVTRPARS